MTASPPTADPSSPTDVVVLTWDAPTASDRRAHKIAAFLGANPTFFALAPDGSGAVRSRSRERHTCLIVDVETLALASAALPDGTSGLVRLTSELADHVFVYGFDCSDRHNTVLRALSGGLLNEVGAVEANSRFDVSALHREWCGPFSGLSFQAPGAGPEQGFVASDLGDREAPIRLGGRPLLAVLDRAGVRFAFAATAELSDLDEPVGHQTRVLSYFSRLIPLMMCLRGALGRRVWHNDQPRACFIIDDPSLQERHGFLDYGRLVDSIRRRHYSVCIAFIPWNYRRSDRKIAGLVASAGAIGLCVHGCDHTRGEFATNDFESLRGKSQLALERMRAHRSASGVPFDEVMVFPQGLFSAQAMSALKASGYLAAINSDLLASHGEASALRLRDLLDVAVTSYSGFPLFGRRYPRDLAEFALDLFVGKPALAVEHHGFFREGYAALESFVEKLRGLDTRLQWATPGAICSRASLTKTAADGELHIRFYTRRFQLTNSSAHEQRYRLLLPQTTGEPPTAVTVDGRPWACESENGQVTIRLVLGPRQAADIALASAAPKSTAAWKATVIHAASVTVRRHLCDFRDNHVDTNQVLSSVLDGTRRARREARRRVESLAHFAKRSTRVQSPVRACEP